MKWSDKDRKILIQEVKKSPDSLVTAFSATSSKIGRSVEAVKEYYYNSLYMKNYKNNHIIFMIVSEDKKCANFKNSTKNRKTTFRETIINQFFKLIKK